MPRSPSSCSLFLSWGTERVDSDSHNRPLLPTRPFPPKCKSPYLESKAETPVYSEENSQKAEKVRNSLKGPPRTRGRPHVTPVLLSLAPLLPAQPVSVPKFIDSSSRPTKVYLAKPLCGLLRICGLEGAGCLPCHRNPWVPSPPLGDKSRRLRISRLSSAT